MKDTEIKFRCSEEIKQLAKSMAASEGKTLTDYLSDLIWWDWRTMHTEVTVEAVAIMRGEEIARTVIAKVLVDDAGRCAVPAGMEQTAKKWFYRDVKRKIPESELTGSKLHYEFWVGNEKLEFTGDGIMPRLLVVPSMFNSKQTL